MPYIVYIEMIMIDRHDRAHPLGFRARYTHTDGVGDGGKARAVWVYQAI